MTHFLIIKYDPYLVSLIACVILTIDDNLVSGQCTVLYINKMSVQSTRTKVAVANRFAIQRISARQHYLHYLLPFCILYY